MARTRRAEEPPSLTQEQVRDLRAQLQRGEQPRVAALARSGVPAGTRGPIVRMGDPSDQEEFIVVRLGGDELPFAPEELTLAARGRRPAAPADPTPAKPAKPARATKASTAAPAAKPARPTSSARSGRSKPAPPGASESPPTTAQAPADHPSPAKATSRPAPRRAGRRKPPAGLTVTLRFAEGSWTVEASRGERRVGKPSPIPARAARQIAELVADEQVRALVEETVDSCREEVAGRAAALREELAAVEAALAEYGG